MPAVTLLDARTRGLDLPGLREWARSASRESGDPHASRSYRYPYALVATHTRRVGVDLERIEYCDTAFAELICTREERSDPACRADPDRYLTSVWSSKEALSKALGDARRYEPARLESPRQWPRRSAGCWRAMELGAPPGFVAWLCWEAHASTRPAA